MSIPVIWDRRCAIRIHDDHDDDNRESTRNIHAL